MELIKKFIIQAWKRAAGRPRKWAVGALLCFILSGCGETDRALSIEIGSTVELPADTAESSILQNTSGAEEVFTEVCVYVCGAVKHPGVVRLPEGSRYQDALEAAGGFAEAAAQEAVNLAKPVIDGEQIYFPTQEEAQATESAVQSEEPGLVNINQADVDKLCDLPGIGEAKAREIISYRESNGSFETIEEIMKVPGIKENAYNRLKDFITVR